MTETLPLVERIAAYASGLRFDAIAPEAVQAARRLIFDTLGTGLGGYQKPLGQKAARFGADGMPGHEATILGNGHVSSLEGAAFANATMVKILGMDDSHRSASHIAAQVIPAALAVGEHGGISGADLIVAVVAAYDLAVRVGQTVRNEQRKRGLDVKGTVGTIAASLAAGLCAGLGQRKLAHAMGLAADLSSGTEQYVYDRGDCDTKDLISGFSARNGVFAVRLANDGFFGPQGGLDGEYGFFRAFGGGTYEPADFDALGQDFLITTSAFKPHGGCRHTHQAVDAIQQIQRDSQVDPAEIERVEVRTYQYALQPSFRVDPDPGSRELAGLSIRVATAVALVRGSAWPDDYEYWDDPEVRRLRRLVEIEVEPEIEATYPDRNGARVVLELRDGRTLEGFVEYAGGEPENPMSEEQLKAKFEALNGQLLPAGRCDEIFSACMRLEELDSVVRLMELSTVGGA